jgi:hypothetical protein
MLTPDYQSPERTKPKLMPKGTPPCSPKEIIDRRQLMRELQAKARPSIRMSTRILVPEESNEVNWLLNVFDPEVNDMSEVSEPFPCFHEEGSLSEDRMSHDIFGTTGMSSK